MPSPSLSSPASTITPSGNVQVDALIGSAKWGDAVGTASVLTYSFPWLNGASAVFTGVNGTAYSDNNEPNSSQHFGLSAAQQTAATGAMQAWANVANIGFKAVADNASTVGDIRFAFSNAASLASSWGHAYWPNSYWPSAGDIWISAASAQDTDWSVGSYNYEALIHEIGHALGLKHPFEDGTTLPANLDSRLYTLMSYTDPANNLFVKVVHQANGAVYWTSYTINPETPMLLDIAAMQYLYGANYSYNAGDTVYTFDPNTPFLKTIWDGAGRDTISTANFTQGCLIDINPGHASSIATALSDSTAGYKWTSPPPTPTYDAKNNLWIAYNCVIENVTAGSGNDTIIGNTANNVIDAGAGDDIITTGGGDDVLTGGGGADTFNAYAGGLCTVTDLGNGKDVLIVGPGTTVVATAVAPWTASASSQSSGSASINTPGLAIDLSAVTQGSYGFKVTNTATTSTATNSAGVGTTLRGSALDDVLTGGPGSDTLQGNAGNDRLVSGGGNDTVIGDSGTDTLVLNATTADVLAHSSQIVFAPGVLSQVGSSSGVCSLSSVERLQLTDGLYAFDTLAPSSAEPQGAKVWQVQALFEAYFARLATTAELSRWTAQADKDSSMPQLAQQMLDIYAPSSAPATTVAYLYRMLTGAVAPSSTVDSLTALIGAGKTFATQGEFFAAAAMLEINTVHLVGISGSIQVLDASYFA